jgi:hypothetical protein
MKLSTIGRRNGRSGVHSHIRLVIVAASALGCASANSITITCPLTACSGISYTLTGSSPSVGLSFTPSSTVTGTNWGVLTETGTFSSLSPLSIDFLENTPYSGTANNFGFRVTMVQNLTDSSGFSWSGIQEVLQDASPQAIADAVHPGFAHFHTDAGLSFGPFTTTSAFNSTASLTANGGTLANGATLNATGIGVHEWSVPGVARHFTLVETPTAGIPEPSTVVLGSLGLALLAAARRLRPQRP